jgi:hypothetical protein
MWRRVQGARLREIGVRFWPLCLRPHALSLLFTPHFSRLARLAYEPFTKPSVFGSFAGSSLLVDECRWFRKREFANDIEHFGRKMPEERRVKNHKLSEGVSPSFCDLAMRFRHPQNAHGVSKLLFATYLTNSTDQTVTPPTNWSLYDLFS